jgi:hypothetical protein
MKITYYSKPRTYGGCYFILSDLETLTFCKGLTGSCVRSYQWHESIVDNLTQKQLKQVEESLLKSGYKELTNEDYYNIILKDELSKPSIDLKTISLESNNRKELYSNLKDFCIENANKGLNFGKYGLPVTTYNRYGKPNDANIMLGLKRLGVAVDSVTVSENTQYMTSSIEILIKW